MVGMRAGGSSGVFGWRDGRSVDTVDVLFTASDVFVMVMVKFVAEGNVGASDAVELSTAALELTLPLSPKDKVKIHNVSVSHCKTQYKYK